MSSAPAGTGIRRGRPAFLVLCGLLGLGVAGTAPAAAATTAGHFAPRSEVGSPGPAAQSASSFSRAHSLGVAQAEDAAAVAVPGSGSNAPKPAKKRASLASVGWAVLAIAVLAAAVATPLLLRRHRNRRDTPS